MKLKQSLVITLAGTLSATAAIAQDEAAKNSDTDVQALKQQIEQLEQKVDILEYQEQKDHKAVALVATNSAHLTVGSDGVNFTSANSNFVASAHAVLQVDSRTFFQNGGTPGLDGFLLRRARLIFQGTVDKSFDYYFQTEFAGSGAPQILDAYLNYRFSPELQLEAGKFKPPVGLEQLQSDAFTLFNERSLATDLTSYRSIGAELHGDISGGVFSYAAGIFNGLPDYNTTTINANYNNDMAFGGRVFTSPFKQTSIAPLQGLGVGVSGTYEHDGESTAAGLTPGFTTDGQEKFFTYAASSAAEGAHWRVSPQGYYYYGPLGIEGEYVVSDQQVVKTTAPVAKADLDNTAWQVSGSWVLTGDNASYTGVNPRHPFDLRNGGWGAWQVVGRFAELDLDKAAFPTFATQNATGARAWSAGLNWYLNKNVRANVSFSHTWFTGVTTASAVTQRPENVLFTRMQLAF
jgi:phosphate-selective porin OprO/OprP